MGASILFIDDNSLDQELAQEFLEEEGGYKVSTYDNIDDALKNYDEEKIVVTDYKFEDQVIDSEPIDKLIEKDSVEEVILYSGFKRNEIEENLNSLLENRDIHYLYKEFYDDLLEKINQISN